MISGSIFIVGGSATEVGENPEAIERLDFEEDQLVNQTVIGETVYSHIPVLFQVSADFCV